MNHSRKTYLFLRFRKTLKISTTSNFFESGYGKCFHSSRLFSLTYSFVNRAETRGHPRRTMPWKTKKGIATNSTISRPSSPIMKSTRSSVIPKIANIAKTKSAREPISVCMGRPSRSGRLFVAHGPWYGNETSAAEWYNRPNEQRTVSHDV